MLIISIESGTERLAPGKAPVEAQSKMKVNGKKTTENESIFDDRIRRLKESLGVRKDSELAEKLGKTQQAIAGARKRHMIPGDWIQRLAQKNVSFDFIYYGRELPEGESPNPNPAVCQDKIDQDIAKSLVRETLKDSGLNLSPDQIPIMETYVKKYILPEAKGKIADFIKDFSRK